MIDPEAGIQISEFQGIGTPQGPFEGTGEGFTSFDWQSEFMRRMPKREPNLYEEIGSALMQEEAQRSALSAGFDMNWLGKQISAGSAEGQHL